jgi:predicted DNA-binding transcriptional regulator AlpA
MSGVTPIDPDRWESEGAVVPVEGPRELAEWLDSLDRQGASWDETTGRRARWGDGYALVVAVRTPGPDPQGPGIIRYFMVSGEDVRALAVNAGGRTERLARRLGLALGPLLTPLADRWRDAWRQAFVRLDQVADMAGVDTATITRWAQEDDDFPLPVLDRGPRSVYVRDEVVEWMERRLDG